MVGKVYSGLGYDDLGNTSLFALYLSFGTSSFFAAKLVSLASPKVIFILSGLGYNLFILVGYIAVHCPETIDEKTELPLQCQEPVIYSYIIFASIICGIGSSTIWVAKFYFYLEIFKFFS